MSGLLGLYVVMNGITAVLVRALSFLSSLMSSARALLIASVISRRGYFSRMNTPSNSFKRFFCSKGSVAIAQTLRQTVKGMLRLTCRG